ncbi:MAG: ABC transporter permease [Candidatus Zixiibacteriota bacterium]|nr:MAG: ABC transporter permease [candidate division Zixibacteria bacterium]
MDLLGRDTLEIVWLSLKVSGSAVILCAIISLNLAFLIEQSDFPGKRLVLSLINTMMTIPAVAIGLLLYLVLMRRGPLGGSEILYTPYAMILAQAILATPIITGLSLVAIRRIDPSVRDTAFSLGATRFQWKLLALTEARFAISAAVITGFARVVGETGMTMMVGGNIKGATRVMTTAIALETMKGEFELAISLGIILVIVALGINLMLHLVQGAGKRR